MYVLQPLFSYKISVFCIKLGRKPELGTNTHVPSYLEVGLAAQMHFYIVNSHLKNITSSSLKKNCLIVTTHCVNDSTCIISLNFLQQPYEII